MSNLPAYPIRSSAMRPVTKITILGIRLGVVVLGAYWLMIFVGTHLPGSLDFSPQANDKIKHFGAFFVLGTLMCYVTTSPRLVARFSLIGAIGVGYAIIDELTQHFIPRRVPDFYDVVADSFGLFAAIGCYLTLRFFLKGYLDQKRDRPSVSS